MTQRATSYVLTVVLGTFAMAAGAVSMEPDSPGYLTDSHGAGGVLRALMEVRDDFPEYDGYIRGTLQWLYDVRIERDGAFTWMMSTSAPEGHPSHVENPATALQILPILLKLDPELKDPLYEKLYTGCVKTLDRMQKGSRITPGKKPPIGLGHSHGPGVRLSTMAELYGSTHNEQFKKWAILMAEIVKNDAEEWVEDDGTRLATWRLKPNERNWWRQTDWRTGWCYGTVGNCSGLMTFYEGFPDYRFEDGTSALDLASAGLNWILTERVVVGNGWTFLNMRTDGPSENPGWGSGVAGIGYGFLQGYNYHKDTNPKLADVYLDAARKCAIYICELLRDPKDDPHLREMNVPQWDYLGRAHRMQYGGFESLNLGLCGGIGGTGRFLLPMAETVKDSEPELAAQCVKATRVIANWFETRSVPCGSGVAWTARPKFGGENTINMALDYGLSGMVIAVHQMAFEMDDQELKALTRQALDGMTSLAVKEGDGYKWPLFTKVADLRKR